MPDRSLPARLPPLLTELPRVDYQFPPAGQTGPLLALVGEAPGADEVRLGYPFAGRSGKLLDAALVAVGLHRPACLIANVFRLQPPANKVGLFFASRARAQREGLELAEEWGRFGGSDWCLRAFAGELQALSRTLERLRPRVIVALGRTPLWALTGRGEILKCRGTPLPCRLAEGLTVIPTYHPSFLLRGQRHLEPVFQADLALAARRLTLADGTATGS
jgi:DNA polymerase